MGIEGGVGVGVGAPGVGGDGDVAGAEFEGAGGVAVGAQIFGGYGAAAGAKGAFIKEQNGVDGYISSEAPRSGASECEDVARCIATEIDVIIRLSGEDDRAVETVIHSIDQFQRTEDVEAYTAAAQKDGIACSSGPAHASTEVNIGIQAHHL